MEAPRKSLALLLIVIIVLSQRKTVVRQEGAPGKICELHYEPDVSTQGYQNAIQTGPCIAPEPLCLMAERPTHI